MTPVETDFTSDLKVNIFMKISIKFAKIRSFSVKIKSFSMKISSVRENENFSRKYELYV